MARTDIQAVLRRFTPILALRRVAWVVCAVGVAALVAVMMLPRPHHYSVIPNTAHLLPSADPAHGHQGH